MMTNDPHAESLTLQAGVPLGEAALAVVLLHGRGASAADILELGSLFNLPDIAYIAPQAAANTWYPQSFLAPREANEPYLTSALARIDSVVTMLQQAGFARKRIVLAGFSQGACLATEFVVSRATAQDRFAGLIAFTGGLIGPPGSLQTPSASTELTGMRALLSSGDPDPHVPWARVEESAAILQAMGAIVTTRRYPGRPHTVTPAELTDARNLLVGIQQ